MSLTQFLRIIWARRLIILLATLSCLMGGLIAIKIMPERFEANSRVMLDIIKPDPVTGEFIASPFVRAYTKSQTEMIRDYRVTGLVVEQLGWLKKPVLMQQYRDRVGAKDLNFRRWLSQRISDSIDAKPVEASNIIEITATSTSPDSARVIADAVRRAYIDVSLAFRRDTSARSADWYDGQTKKVRDQLAAAEAAKAKYERETGIILQPDDSDLESTRLHAIASAPSAPVVTQGASTGSLELANIDAAIAQASQTLGPNHPDLIAMRQRRSLVASQLAAMHAPTIVSGGGPSLETQRSVVIGQRDKVDRLRRLKAEVDLRRDQFNKTAARAAELRQQAEIIEPGLTVMGSAVAPEKPVSPNRPLILFGSLGFGFGLGVLIALLTELLARRVRGMEDLESAVSAPLLAVIGATPTPARSPTEGLARLLGMPLMSRSG